MPDGKRIVTDDWLQGYFAALDRLESLADYVPRLSPEAVNALMMSARALRMFSPKEGEEVGR